MEQSNSIGYDKIKTGMSFEELQKIIKTNYSDWSITYVDLNPNTYEDNPDVESVAPDGYYALTNNSGITISIELTEGMTGEVCGVSVRESFQTTSVLYTQYYLLKYILTQKYGTPSEGEGPDNGEGFEYDVYTVWKKNNQSITILGSYCTSSDGKGKEVSCHSVTVDYSDEQLYKKRSSWIEVRRNAQKKLKYKNDYSKY